MAEEDSKKSLGECITSTQFPMPIPSPIPSSKEKPKSLGGCVCLFWKNYFLNFFVFICH
jgi:hypothetical protein